MQQLSDLVHGVETAIRSNAAPLSILSRLDRVADAVRIAQDHWRSSVRTNSPDYSGPADPPPGYVPAWAGINNTREQADDADPHIDLGPPNGYQPVDEGNACD